MCPGARLYDLDNAAQATPTRCVSQRLTIIKLTRADTIRAQDKVFSLFNKRTRTSRHGGHPARRNSTAAISLAAHPKLGSSGLLLLLRQKFGLFGLQLLLLLLLLQRGGGGGGGGGGAAGGTSSSRNVALLGALGAGDRKQNENFAVVAVVVAFAAAVASAAAEVSVLLWSR